jgi:hypothetical protein
LGCAKKGQELLLRTTALPSSVELAQVDVKHAQGAHASLMSSSASANEHRTEAARRGPTRARNTQIGSQLLYKPERMERVNYGRYGNTKKEDGCI